HGPGQGVALLAHLGGDGPALVALLVVPRPPPGQPRPRFRRHGPLLIRGPLVQSTRAGPAPTPAFPDFLLANRPLLPITSRITSYDDSDDGGDSCGGGCWRRW